MTLEDKGNKTGSKRLRFSFYHRDYRKIILQVGLRRLFSKAKSWQAFSPFFEKPNLLYLIMSDGLTLHCVLFPARQLFG